MNSWTFPTSSLLPHCKILMLLEGLLEAVSLRIWATLSIDIPANQLELRYMNIDGDAFQIDTSFDSGDYGNTTSCSSSESSSFIYLSFELSQTRTPHHFAIVAFISWTGFAIELKEFVTHVFHLICLLILSLKVRTCSCTWCLSYFSFSWHTSWPCTLTLWLWFSS